MMSIKTFTALLSKYLQEDQYLTFITTLDLLDLAMRELVVNIKYNNTNNLVFTACQMTRINYLDYMLSECQPDLEIRGMCFNDEHNTVQLLINHHAKVNTISSSGSTSLMAACSSGQLDIVILLVANGADIHFKNDQGITCLMTATQYPDIIHLLVKCGSRVNETDSHGNTALHYAAVGGWLHTVHILIELGANPFIVNLDKCNAILAAAKAKEEHIVEYLLTVRTPKASDIINSYIVLGAMTILLDDNYTAGRCHWHKAITLRQLSPGSLYHFKVKKSILSEYFNENDLVALWEHVTDHHDVLSLQALVICESLYGAHHQSFINLLVYRGAVSADSDKLLTAIRLWTLAYKLNLNTLDNPARHGFKYGLDLLSSLVKNVQYIVQLLFQVQKLIFHDSLESAGGSVPENLTRDLLSFITQHIELLVDRSGQHNTQHLTCLLHCYLGVFHLYLHMYSPTARHPHIGLYLQRIIHLDPRGDRNETILHMCLGMRWMESLDIGQHMTAYWPSDELMDILLIIGANPFAKDEQGNTVLHRAILLHFDGYNITTELINKLFKRGVHYDQVNERGQTAFDLLPNGDGFKHFAHSFSLKCLAARSVAKYKLAYIGEIPRDLYSFVELHVS
ncbi:hypothetical protein Btru_059535 [Bulinus truncatus]|nr:hypothetical protein Btru_059535 [Bulinus truncatus]